MVLVEEKKHGSLLMGGLWGLGSNSNSLAVPPCVSFYLGATLGCFDGAVAKLKSQICASLPLVSFLSTRRAVCRTL